MQPLLNLSKNNLLVICITNLKRIREKFSKLSRPQGQISNKHNKFEEDTWKTFQVIAPTRSNYWRKIRKIAINRQFWFFSAIIELVQELLISNMHNKFEEDTWKLFKSQVTRSNYWCKRRKIAISRPFKKNKSAIIEFVRELVISNMHNKFGKDTWKTCQVIAPSSKCQRRRRRHRTSIAIAHLF